MSVSVSVSLFLSVCLTACLSRLSKEEKYEESRCNYERYRTLVQNIYHKTSEAEALAKIEAEEMYKEPVRKGGKKKKK